jgi:hypothetical protein
MTKPKYTLKMSHILEQSGIHKLERDGHSKEAIHKLMYKETAGATQREREQIISKLYDRKE